MTVKVKNAAKKTAKKKPTKGGQIVATNRNVDGTALKKAIEKREPAAPAKTPEEAPKVVKIDKYLVAVVRGVRFGINSDGITRRLVTEEPVYSDRDLANEPDEKNKLVAEKMEEMSKGLKGICFNDLDAIREARDSIEANLDVVRHQLRYGIACPECAAEKLGHLVEALHVVGSFEDRLQYVTETCSASSIPNVLPACQDMDIQGDRIVYKKNYPVQIHTVLGQGQPTIDQLPEDIRELVKGFIGDPNKPSLPPANQKKIPLKK